jgi:hypothetical protein
MKYMKKLLFLCLCTGLTLGAIAQDSARKAGMKDMRKDVRDLKKDKKERAADVKAGNKEAATQQTKDIKSDKKDIAADAKTLKAEGVKHPVKRAVRQVKVHH